MMTGIPIENNLWTAYLLTIFFVVAGFAVYDVLYRRCLLYTSLSNGVNAVAHSCYDYRMPGKKDDVSFAVTRLDMERGVAVGIITRIIRQNL